MNAATFALALSDPLPSLVYPEIKLVKPKPAPATAPGPTAFLQKPAPPLSVIIAHLQRVASEAKMTFFVRFFKRPDEFKGCSEETIHHRANAVTSVLSEILSFRGGFPHGGINE